MITLTTTGHVTADAITRDYNGNTVISFSVASNNRFKTSTGEVKEETTFIRCAIWNSNEKLAPLFFKGRVVTVTGTLKCSIYNDRVNLDLRVSNFQVFGKGNREEETTQSNVDEATAPLYPEIKKAIQENELESLREEFNGRFLIDFKDGKIQIHDQQENGLVKLRTAAKTIQEVRGAINTQIEKHPEKGSFEEHAKNNIYAPADDCPF